jgi:hypothetical protein
MPANSLEYGTLALALTFSVLFTAGCSSRSSGGTEEIAPFPVVERTSGACAAATLPMQLPTVGAIVDTSALASWLQEGAIGVGKAIMSVVFTGVTERSTTSILETDMDEADAASIAKAVDSSLVAGDMAVGPWSVRLQITSGPQLDYEIMRSEYCPPSPREAPVGSRTLGRVVTAAEMEQILQEARESEERRRRMRLFEARCLIDRDGNIVVTEVATGTGNREDDRTLGMMLRRTLFNAPTLDGVPVAGWWVGNPMPRSSAR